MSQHDWAAQPDSVNMPPTAMRPLLLGRRQPFSKLLILGPQACDLMLQLNRCQLAHRSLVCSGVEGGYGCSGGGVRGV